MTEDRIHKICEKYKITNYTINPDMSVDVNGNVNLANKTFKKLPLEFNRVAGNFSCAFGTLTSLEGCPKYVGGEFTCSHNKNLQNLVGCPQYVKKDFRASYIPFLSLEGLPANFFVGGRFVVRQRAGYHNNAYEYRYILFGTIMSEIATSNDDLNEFLNKHKNPPKKDLPRLLSELRKIQL